MAGFETIQGRFWGGSGAVLGQFWGGSGAVLGAALGKNVRLVYARRSFWEKIVSTRRDAIFGTLEGSSANTLRFRAGPVGEDLGRGKGSIL